MLLNAFLNSRLVFMDSLLWFTLTWVFLILYTVLLGHTIRSCIGLKNRKILQLKIHIFERFSKKKYSNPLRQQCNFRKYCTFLDIKVLRSIGRGGSSLHGKRAGRVKRSSVRSWPIDGLIYA